MKKIIYFHRNKKAGFSINKVTQTIVHQIDGKVEYFVPHEGGGILSLLKNILFIIKRREKDAIHHITGDIHYGILGLIGYKSVLTIHDTVGLDFLNMGKLKSFIYGLLWFKLPLIYSTKVVCISEVTKSYLLKYTRRKDIQVIHNAIDSTLDFSPLNPIKHKAKILFIGVKENKNLIRCFKALKDLPCHVTIVGKLHDYQIKELHELGLNYTNKWNLSDEELNQEYINCDIVSFCSLFEGFGMPALEANQAGRPVLCSDIAVLREVAGDAACFVDPYSIESIREGYMRLIQDNEYRMDLVEKGRKNVSNYQPSFIKQQWENIYLSLSNS